MSPTALAVGVHRSAFATPTADAVGLIDVNNSTSFAQPEPLLGFGLRDDTARP